MKRMSSEKVTIVPAVATSKSDGQNVSSPKRSGARPSKPLTPAQRGRFWQSVGDAIEAAQVRKTNVGGRHE